MYGSELIKYCKKDSFFHTEQSDIVFITIFYVAIVWQWYFIVHLFGNAPICASTVLECSRAAPNIQSMLYGTQGVTKRCRLSWLTNSVLWVGKGISFRKNSLVDVERAVQRARRSESPNFETFRNPGTVSIPGHVTGLLSPSRTTLCYFGLLRSGPVF